MIKAVSFHIAQPSQRPDSASSALTSRIPTPSSAPSHTRWAIFERGLHNSLALHTHTPPTCAVIATPRGGPDRHVQQDASAAPLTSEILSSRRSRGVHGLLTTAVAVAALGTRFGLSVVVPVREPARCELHYSAKHLCSVGLTSIVHPSFLAYLAGEHKAER